MKSSRKQRACIQQVHVTLYEDYQKQLLSLILTAKQVWIVTAGLNLVLALAVLTNVAKNYHKLKKTVRRIGIHLSGL